MHSANKKFVAGDHVTLTSVFRVVNGSYQHPGFTVYGYSDDEIELLCVDADGKFHYFDPAAMELA